MGTGPLPDPGPRRPAGSPRHLVNLLATGATQFLDAFVPTAMVLMIANRYGLEPLGDFCVAMAFGSIAALLCGTGIANAVCFEVAAAEDRQSHNALLMAGTVGFGACFLAALPLIAWASSLVGPEPASAGLVVVLSIGYGLRALGGLFNAPLRGRREMQVAVWPMVVTLLLAAVTVVPLLAMRRPLFEVALAWTACQACPPIWLFVEVRRRGLATSWRGVPARIGPIARSSLLLTLESVVFRVGMQVAVVVLPLLLTSREIGLYNAAAKPFQLLVLANECVIQFFLPYLAAVPQSATEELDSRLQRFHKLAFFFTATTLVLVAVFSSSIASMLFGETGPVVAPFMAVLAFGYILYYSPPYSGGFKSIGKSRLSVLCAVAQTVTVLASLPLLVPSFGVWGVVSAVCLAYAVYWLMEVWLYHASRLTPVKGVGRYVAFLVFNLCCGSLLEASVGGLAAMAIFLAVASVASLGLYWTGQERRLALGIAFPKVGIAFPKAG